MNRGPSYWTKRDTHYGKTRLKYGHFSDILEFLWAQMAKLSLTGFKIGLPIHPFVNDRHIKLATI